jgi:hypothetical protein
MFDALEVERKDGSDMVPSLELVTEPLRMLTRS